MEQGLDHVLNLLASRAVGGEVTNEDVEAAIEELLRGTRSNAGDGDGRTTSDVGVSTNTAKDTTVKTARTATSNAPLHSVAHQASVVATVAKGPLIDEDKEDYDDDDENDSSSKPPAAAPAGPATTKLGRPRKHPVTNPIKTSAVPQTQNNNHLYELIPLGIQGAKMLVAFGDGPQPLPAVVAKTLQVTRTMLHAAIRDTRHVRKRNQLLYRQAQQYVRGQKPQPKHLQQQKQQAAGSRTKKQRNDASQQHLFHFRAMQRQDALGFSPKCGFDVEDLRLLFPEEVNAYQKWNDMHNSTTKAAEEVATTTTNFDGDGGDNDDNNNSNNDTSSNNKDTTDNLSTGDGEDDDDVVVVAGGHLEERLEQFDIRTNRMEQDDYLQFSNVRYQGSFLPRRGVREDQHREEASVRGRPMDGCTSRMPSVTLRFLHWVGFDITGTVSNSTGDDNSSSTASLRLAAPNSETIQVLAFLAHDFFGRIVEKSIFWRNVGMDETKVVLELKEGEQLQESDIDRALQDPEIRLTSLYATTQHDKDQRQRCRPKPQLYFGPGFEDRLEMELEEMVESRLSEEEVKQREEEDALFARLAAPPSVDDVLDDDVAQREGDDAGEDNGDDGDDNEDDDGVENDDDDKNNGCSRKRNPITKAADPRLQARRNARRKRKSPVIQNEESDDQSADSTGSGSNESEEDTLKKRRANPVSSRKRKAVKEPVSGSNRKR